MELEATSVIVSNVLLFISLGVLTFQVREMAKQTATAASATRAAVFQSIRDIMVEVNKMFVDRPELRPYFYEGVAVPKRQPTRARVQAAAEMVVDLIDNVVVQGPDLPRELFAPWHEYFADVVRTSPAIREYWQANSHWYCLDTHAVIDAAIASLELARPASPPPTASQ